jgi:hypothetical protein
MRSGWGEGQPYEHAERLSHMSDHDFYEENYEEVKPSSDSWLLIGHDGENGRWWTGKRPCG